MPVAPFRADPSASSGQALKVSATTPGISPAKPFTRDQVQGLVRDGLGDDSGAKLIEQRGIDFTPAEDFIQSLKAAGASEAFLNALRAAKPPQPASAKKPLNQVQIILLLAGQVPSHRVATLVKERGIDFEPQDDYLQEVRLGGGDDELITALKSAKVTKPINVDPALQARKAEVRQHAARGAELSLKHQCADAEREYRAALLPDSQDADVYVSLAYVLDMQKKWDDAATAAREALRLDPNNELAHYNLGDALGNKGDLDGEIAEYREALSLNPSTEAAHRANGSQLRKLLKNILSRQAEACETQRKGLLKESLAGPSPYELASEITPSHIDALLMRRTQDASPREVPRLTNLLLKIKRRESTMEPWEANEDDLLSRDI